MKQRERFSLPITTKTCRNPDCPEDNPQPLSNFHRSAANKDGRHNRCKVCRKKEQAEYYKSNATFVRKQQDSYYDNNADAILLHKVQKYREDNNITEEDIKKREEKKVIVRRIQKEKKQLRARLKEYRKDLRMCDRIMTKYHLNNDSNVYIIREDGTDYYKIGIAKDSKARLTSHQVSNPHHLSLYYSKFFRYPKVIEDNLHTLLTDDGKRHSGEWFILDADDLDKIVKYVEDLDEDENFDTLKKNIQWLEEQIDTMQSEVDKRRGYYGYYEHESIKER